MPSQAKRQRKKEGARARAEAARLAQARSRRRRLIILGVVAVAIVVGLAYAVSRPKKKSTNVSSKSTTTVAGATGTPPQAKPVPAGATVTGDTPCPKTDGSSPRTSKFAKAPPMCIDPAKSYTATFNTTEGKIVVALDTKKTPQTANNFAVLALYHYYDGSAIFRTDTSIDIIQGGSPSTQSPSDPGPGYTINDEGSGYTYSAGDLVMARTGSPNSAGAQYFFVTGPAASGLNGQGTYVTFGNITQGLDVAQKIIGLNETDPSSQLGGGPKRVVTVKSITITAT